MAYQIQQLQSVAYFAGLKQPDLEAIARYLHPRSLERDEFVHGEGDPIHSLFLVQTGAVKLFLTSAEGREQVLGIARPGDSFNDVAALTGSHCLTNATTMSAVQLYTLNGDDLRRIMGQHPAVRENALLVLSREIKRLISLVADLSFMRVTARLARLLLEQSTAGPGAPRLTQQQMAAMVGTVREMIGRALKDLEIEGAIRMERHRIVIADVTALKRLSETPE